MDNNAPQPASRSDDGTCSLCGVTPETQKFCPPEVKCPMRDPAISPQEIVKELHACMHGLNANSAFSGKLTRDAVYRKLSALAGKVAVMTAPRSEQGTSDREGRAAIMDRTIYHRMLTDLCTLILGSAAPIGPMRSRADYPPELAKAIKWLKDVQAREQARPAERPENDRG